MWDSLTLPRKLKTQCTNIDQCLQGGFPTIGVHEVFGEGSTAKTQLCIQLSLAIQLPESEGGLNGKCLYICTNKIPPLKRFKQIKERFSDCNDCLSLDNIYLERCLKESQLYPVIFSKIAGLTHSKGFKLVVIDSICDLFKQVDGNSNLSNYYDNYWKMRNILMKLKELALNYQIVVLLVNNVTLTPESNEPKPCLGYFFALLINTRILMSREYDELGNKKDERFFKIISPQNNNTGLCKFKVRDKGLVDA